MTPMAPNDPQPREAARNPEQRTQLADLIRARRKELNVGLKAFAERAIDPTSGVQITRGWVYRLEQGEPVTPPVYEELVALAAACELPVETLQDAAGSQFHGVDPLVSGSSEAKAYVHKLDQLPPDQRERLLRLIDTLVPPPGSPS